ncbi:AroM family protein [Lysinibacillus parviboronicapiens]|uniref:AroM family protein n=1 Tax=Lysinibacillus parviboronicapiens TaxID=436516 RepID=UPI001EE70DED|nr:AroM family protein [Lysinibacillus parviboronicapiens]
MNSNIAIVTIGQAPRKDMADDILQLKKAGLHVTEFGVLDLLSSSEIATLAPSIQDLDVLVTLLANGKQVKLSKKKLLPFIQKRINDLTEHTWILFMCTGDFTNALVGKNLLLPDRLLTHLVYGIHADLKLGLIGPEPEQLVSIADKWHKAKFDFTYAASSPYHYNEQHLLGKAKKLQQQGADILILDCMGYSTTMKNAIKKELSIPIMVPREAVFSILTTIN